MISLLKKSVPFIILLALLSLLTRELFYAKPGEIPSPLIGQTLPAFKLPTLADPHIMLSDKNFRGQVTLINVWASWCYACSLEQPFLLKISREQLVPIYGIVYKDKAEDAKAWLDHYGNPYVMVGDDNNGDVTIDLGVYGTPETFVLNKQGKIIYRHVGIIDQEVWDTVLHPLIKQSQELSS